MKHVGCLQLLLAFWFDARNPNCQSNHSFRAQDGVFHFNTLLTLDLASPYFLSGQQDERFEVVVMENKEDGHVR